MKPYTTSKDKLELLVDIEKKLREGKSGGYERWAKVFNVKQMSKSLLFLQEHGIRDYKDLLAITDKTKDHFNELTDSIKQREERLSEIRELQKTIINYSNTKDVYVAYRKAGYSRKFFAEHEQEIIIYKAAKELFSHYEKDTIPKMKELKEEYQRLLSEKRLLYQEYQQKKKNMREYLMPKKHGANTWKGRTGRKRGRQERAARTKSRLSPSGLFLFAYNPVAIT